MFEKLIFCGVIFRYFFPVCHLFFDFVYGILCHVEGDFYVVKFIRFFYIGVFVPILKGLSP